jgi:hypothetical protein
MLEGREGVLINAVDEICNEEVLAVRTKCRIASIATMSSGRDAVKITHMRVGNSFTHLTDQGSIE